MARKILFLPEEILKDSREVGSVPKAGGVSVQMHPFPGRSAVDLCLLDGGAWLISGTASRNVGLNFHRSAGSVCRIES